MDKFREIEKQYIEAKRHVNGEYRLVFQDNKYIIQHYFKVANFWSHCKEVPREPVVGFWSFLGIGDLEFNNQEVFAKKYFIDFIFSKKQKKNFTII